MINIGLQIQLADPASAEKFLLALGTIVGADAAPRVSSGPIVGVALQQPESPAGADAAQTGAETPAKAKTAKKSKAAAPAAPAGDQSAAEAPKAPAKPAAPLPDLNDEEMRELCRQFAADHGAAKLAALLATFGAAKTSALPRANGGADVKETMLKLIGGVDGQAAA